MPASDRRAVYWASWGAVLALALLAYAPGLGGGFLFDDFVNLPALGESGPIRDWPTFWRYITSGTADPTGRPLSLLTFLLDARDWPADPAPFLRTNLAIHLANGTLLLVFLRQLGRYVGPGDRREDWAALVAAAIWTLHPLLVSTTLYIVQREAMLPVTFILMGLIAYGEGRSRFASSSGRRGATLMVLGLALGTSLAFLSKANGLLLPLLVWVLEATVYPRSIEFSSYSRFTLIKRSLVIAPSLLVIAYLATFALHWNQEARDGWTVGQRAITQGRVVLDYAQLLAVPRSVSTGLYNDGYAVSKGLFDPLSTVLSLALVVAAIVAAFSWRRTKPVLSAAILFFFGGHVLESTVVPLELYFEHRNYLPTLLLFWPLSRWLAKLGTSPSTRIAACSALLLLLAFTTWTRAEIWGTPERLASLWAMKNPESSRAQATAAIAELKAGRPDKAMQRLDPLLDARPGDLQIAFNYVNSACLAGGLSRADLDRLSNALRVGQTGSLLVRQWLEKAVRIAGTGQCPGLDLPAVDQLLAAARSNPAINTPVAREKSLPPLLGMLALERGDPDEALENFDRALAANVSPETAAGQASLLASHGYFRQALAHLDTYERIKHTAPRPHRGMPWIHRKVLERQGYWPKELGRLRKNIAAELAAGPERK